MFMGSIYNDYYDPALKKARAEEIMGEGIFHRSSGSKNRDSLFSWFEKKNQK